MSEFKFVPGEYKTRDGRRAIVRFRVQEPCETKYPLAGEILSKDGKWSNEVWTDLGEFTSSGDQSRFDLVPPVRYCYKNCFEHDTGGRYTYEPLADCSVSCADRIGVLRFELTPQDRPDWRTVEFIPVENLEHA